MLSLCRCFAIVGLAAAPSLCARADEQPAAVPSRIITPSFGRPAFVAPGQAFRTAIAPAPDVEATTFVLVQRRNPAHEHALEVVAAEAGNLTLRAPADTPLGTYDFEVRTAEQRLVARHCVAVATLGQRVRLVHLADLRLGHVTVPTLDERLIAEINLLSPTLVITTGDYLERTHPDPEQGWQAVVDYLAGLDAPVLMAAGDQDDMTAYSAHVAASPVGTVDLGRYLGVVLLDHAAAPLAADADQRAWAERVLNVPNDDRITFLVGHAAAPGLLRAWREIDQLRPMLRAGRVGLCFVGGGHISTEQQDSFAGEVAPMRLIHTPPGSTLVDGGSRGPSYRVIDLVGERATEIRASAASRDALTIGSVDVTPLPHDVAVCQSRFQATNRLGQPLIGLSHRVVLANPDRLMPWCLGARLTQVTHVGRQTICRVEFDLPARGMAQVALGLGEAPSRPTVDVLFGIAGPLAGRPRTDHGLRLAAPDTPLTVHLSNRGDSPVVVEPLVMLAGQTVPYRVVDANSGSALAFKLRLVPPKSVTLALDPAGLVVPAGRQQLAVYLRGGVACTATTAEVALQSAAGQSPPDD